MVPVTSISLFESLTFPFFLYLPVNVFLTTRIIWNHLVLLLVPSFLWKSSSPSHYHRGRKKIYRGKYRRVSTAVDNRKWTLTCRVKVSDVCWNWQKEVTLVTSDCCFVWEFAHLMFKSVVRMAEWSKLLCSGHSVLWRCGFKSHFWHRFSQFS